MPKGKSKKFIEKKNSVTFHLGHRSQRDPLAADETAPQRVLIPVADALAAKNDKNSKTKRTDKQNEELQKYGIFFDDDYDYLQHLRDVNTLTTEWERVENLNQNKTKSSVNKETKIILPSSVFESEVEEKVGLLNKAAPVSGPQLDLDPDIVAALDDDFDFDNPENELEDNFMELANKVNSENEFGDTDDCSFSDDEHEHDEEDEVCSLNSGGYTFRDEETKSRFTEYSISSSVIRRNKQLTFLDDKFEKMFSAYDENEIGALDCAEIEGYVEPNSNVLMQYAEEYEKQQKEDTENVRKLMEGSMKINVNEFSDSDDNDDDIQLEKLVVNAREKNKWDCKSILSKYSNIYNHPKLISESKNFGKIKIDPKTGIPKDILNGRNPNKLTVQNLNQFEATSGALDDKEYMAKSSVRSITDVLTVRSKNETSEQRKERKQAVKEYRRERRKDRKANIEAFKEEKKRQEKILLNGKKNFVGNRIL